MDLKTLTAAEIYHPGHQVRVIHDLILQQASQGLSLARLLELAWEAGYAAKEAEEASVVARPQPHARSLTESDARTLLMLAGEAGLAERGMAEVYRRRSRGGAAWSWDAAASGWRIEGDDCLIRPGDAGLVIMEAGGEYAGYVILHPGTFAATFPEGTFR